jgi:hypothetical protein
MTEKLVTVATFQMPTDASLAKSVLEANGLTAFLADELTVGVAWHLSNALGGIKLQVAEPDVEQAIAFLQEPDIAPIDVEEGFTDVSEIEEAVNRALRAALFGIIVLPLQLYSLWLLGGLLFSSWKLSYNERWKAFLAAALDLPMLFILGFIPFGLFKGLDYIIHICNILIKN